MINYYQALFGQLGTGLVAAHEGDWLKATAHVMTSRFSMDYLTDKSLGSADILRILELRHVSERLLKAVLHAHTLAPSTISKDWSYPAPVHIK